jgi:hypothetical protein
MLQHDVALDVTFNAGITPWRIANRLGDAEKTRTLEAAGAEVVRPAPRASSETIFEAVRVGTNETVQAFIDSGIDLDHGADPARLKDSGETAQSLALQNGHTGAARILSDARI